MNFNFILFSTIIENSLPPKEQNIVNASGNTGTNIFIKHKTKAIICKKLLP